MHLARDIAFEFGYAEAAVSGDGWYIELWRRCKTMWETVGIGAEAKRSRWWSIERRGAVFKRVRALAKKKVRNQRGLQWIRGELEKKKR